MTFGAMILAAGRGERMRPLSDTTPKPLLEVGGTPLIVRQIRALARAGFTTITINVSHLADRMIAALGDGGAFGVRIHWSRESEPLETAGGIVNALPLLPEGPVLIVSGDIFTDYDYGRLIRIAAHMAADAQAARVHLVMVPNPSYHPDGDFALGETGEDGRAPLQLRRSDPISSAESNLTYGNIGVFDTTLFRGHPRGARLALLPLLLDWIGQRRVSGERYDGRWENVGTPAELAKLDAALTCEASQETPHERH